MKEINLIKKEFNRIKNLGFVKNSRPNNIDGGIGNTFEDQLGIKENNLKIYDFLGFEIKSKRQFNSSYISLFTKSPSFPKRANSYLREKYGEIRDQNHPNIKKLYASVFGNKYSKIYDKYYMKMLLDENNNILYLNIYDLNKILIDQIFWTFESLINASYKLKNLLLVQAEERKEDFDRFVHFNSAEIYYNFQFKNFIEAITNGNIMFDLRIGVYSSGKSLGKTHDHGSGFRINYKNFSNLYEKFEII